MDYFAEKNYQSYWGKSNGFTKFGETWTNFATIRVRILIIKVLQNYSKHVLWIKISAHFTVKTLDLTVVVF